MVDVKTKTGFELSIDEKITDDWEFYEDFSADGRYGEVRGVKRILGDDTYGKLKDHCRNEDGRVSFKKMDEEVSDILTQVFSKNG